jgi:hypothetical protein
MTKHTVCPAILAYRVFKVAEQHKVPVVMYDYYDNCKFLSTIKFETLTDFNINIK